MILSRAAREQLGTLAMVYSVVEQVRSRLDDHSQKMPKVRRVLARLALDHRYAWQFTLEHYGIPYRIQDDAMVLMLPEKQHSQWLRFVADLRRDVMRKMPAQARRDEGIDARVYINAVLTRVASQADSIPWQHKRRMMVWNTVLGTLQALYEQYDADLADLEAMQSGAKWADGIKAAAL